MWPGIQDSYQKLPESDSGSFRYTRSHYAKYQHFMFCSNYQTKIWKTANIPISEVPKPWEGHRWKDNGEPLAYGVMMTWSSQCLWLTSWPEILKNSTILMIMTITRLVSSSSSSELSSSSVYPSADRLALQKWGYWRSSRLLFDS